ncbi:MAG: hypothetical protein Q9215_002481 [Flavoplaca cf. flavocitrina]
MPAQAGEKLLRIALLSRALIVQHMDSAPQPLIRRRKRLARSLRDRRKKGAFGQAGDNQTAHDLAIGLLLAWLPVFVIATIVDRNPIGTKSIRRKLNGFVEDVRRALLDPVAREAFLNHHRRRETDLSWTKPLETDEFFQDGFFASFAGQGRQRWHYGCAHSITAGMETAYIAAHGEDWLKVDGEAEDAIIWAQVNHQGLFWFDHRMIWQMVSSIIVVGGTLFGAFILSCEFRDAPSLTAKRAYVRKLLD